MKESGNGKMEMQSKEERQALPIISKLLGEHRGLQTTSAFFPSHLMDNAKYSRTNRNNDMQYVQAASQALRSSSTSRLPPSMLRVPDQSRKPVKGAHRVLIQQRPQEKRRSLEEDIALGESANIIERNKYMVTQMSEWKEISHGKNNHKGQMMEKVGIDLRQFYSKRKEFLEVFEELDSANIKTAKIIEVIRCYRTGIAIKLHNIMAKYQKCIELLLKLCYDNDCRAQAELNRRIKMVNEATHHYEDKRQRTDDEIKALHNLIKAKEIELRGVRASEEALEHEVRNLREMLQIDVKNYQEVATEVSQKKSMINKAEVMKDEKQDLTSNLKNLNTVVTEIETSHVARSEMLESMNKLVKGLLEKEKEHVGIQVNEGELLWDAEHFLGKNTARDWKEKEDNVYDSPAKNASKGVYAIKSEEKKINETVGLESARDSIKAEPPSANLRAIQNISRNLVQNWNIPPFVVLFISNSLRESKNVVQPEIVFEIIRIIYCN